MGARVRWLRWLRPGLEVKRWIILLAVGILIIDLALAYFLKDAYQNAPWPSWTSYVTLQFLSHAQRGAVFLVLGLAVLVFDDEGHGILKHRNRVSAYGRALEFVRERINA